MEIRTNVAGDVVYAEVARSLQVGQYLRISPSQGYAGVYDGVIKITHILSASDITNLAGDDDVQDVISLIESYKEVQLDMHMDRDEVPYEPEYSEELRRMDSTVWVVYQYMYETDNQLWVFPIEEFLQHTSLF